MSDKVFLITGASSGIGAATARSAAQAGYRLGLIGEHGNFDTYIQVRSEISRIFRNAAARVPSGNKTDVKLSLTSNARPLLL